MKRFALIVVSDRVAASPSLDELRRVVEEALARSCSECRLEVVDYVPNDVHEIRKSVYRSLDSADIVLVCGGTGISERDVSVEAVKPIVDKEIPGFGEELRRRSIEKVGLRALASRCFAGAIRGKLLFVLPGSPDAVELALQELILEELEHLLGVARGASHWQMNVLEVEREELLSDVDYVLRFAKPVVSRSRYFAIVVTDTSSLRIPSSAGIECKFLVLKGVKRSVVVVAHDERDVVKACLDQLAP